MALLIALAISSCGSKENKITATTVRTPPPPPKVEAFIVSNIPVGENLELPGSVMANEATQIIPEISGRLVYLNPVEGKRVSKGTLLAKIYDGDLKAQLNKLQVQLKVQEQTMKRYEQLLAINGVSQQEYDLIRLESSNIAADIQIVKSNIQRTEIRAPFNGTVGLKQVSPGAYVSPQTVITTLRQNSDLKLDFTLPEKYTSQLKTGQVLDFLIDGNKKTYKAKVSATESGVSETDRSLRVRANVTNPDDNLLPGVFVKVNLAFAQDTNAIMVPSQAVIPQARGKQVVRFTGGQVSFAEVTTGLRDSAMVQITSGLKVGDTIITTGLMRLKPGDKVVVNKINGK